MKRNVLVVPAIAVVALAAAACGSSTKSSGGDTGSAAGGSTATSGGAATTAQQDTSGVKKGGTLRVAMEDDFDYWDGQSYTGDQWAIEYAECNGLLDLPDTANPADQAKLIPGLAADLPKVSADKKTFTFTLRQGIKFNNGQVVTPADVKDTYERNLDPKSGFTDGGLGSGYYNDIVGFAAYQKDQSKGLPGIVINGQDVTFKLTEADPAFQYATALRFACIIPKGTPHKHTGTMPPVTGPYMMKSYVPKRSVDFVRNPYWESNAKIMGLDQSKVNNVDAIHWDLGQSTDQMLLKVKNNELDWAGDRGVPTGSAVAEVARDASLKGRFVVFDDSSIRYVFLNNAIPPFNNLKVRQAVNYGIDRQTIVKVAGGANAGQPWSEILPGIMVPDGSKTDAFPNTADQAKAKQLLKDSGLPLPIPVTYQLNSNPVNSKIAQAIKNQLDQVGFKVTLKVVPSAAYFPLVSSSKNKVQMGYAGWGEDYHDGYTFFQPLLNSAGAGEGSNWAQFKNPSVDADMLRVKAMDLGPERVKAWADLSDKVMRADTPWAVYMNKRQPLLASDRVGNFAWSASGKGFYYGLVYLKK